MTGVGWLWKVLLSKLATPGCWLQERGGRSHGLQRSGPAPKQQSEEGAGISQVGSSSFAIRCPVACELPEFPELIRSLETTPCMSRTPADTAVVLPHPPTLRTVTMSSLSTC